MPISATAIATARPKPITPVSTRIPIQSLSACDITAGARSVRNGGNATANEPSPVPTSGAWRHSVNASGHTRRRKPSSGRSSSVRRRSTVP